MIGNTHLSLCHWAVAFFEEIKVKSVYVESVERTICTYCGEPCGVFGIPNSGVTPDFELTLRRWKDNEARTEDVLNATAEISQKTFQGVREMMKKHLQTGEPKYVFDWARNKYVKAEDAEIE